MTYADKIAEILADGNPHSNEELQKVLDPLVIHRAKTVRDSVTRLRKKLKMKGETVICESIQGRYFYRHVRLIGRSE